MCGIYGFFRLDRSPVDDPRVLEAMGKTLIHRGPDDFGHFVSAYGALGHRRLSIIDLSEHGRQPMSNEDGSVWIVFNGEIYNFQDHVEGLKRRGHTFKSHTDTEVILHLYEEEGIACLDKLNGMFAFTLWDRKRHLIYAARDRAGIKPFHYALAGGQFIFASEIKALLKHPAVSREIDLQAVNEYLSFEYVPAPRSIFTDIKKLLPGHFIRIQDGQMEIKRYWAAPYSASLKRKSEAEYAEEFHAILRRSVKRHLMADVPLGVFLSGGVDSSSVSALMRELLPGKISSFNIAFKESSFDESVYSKQVAEYLGTEHHTQVLDEKKALDLIPEIMNYLDEPFGDASFIPTLLLSKFTREHVKVSLSGDGPDELFAGYPTYSAHQAARLYHPLPQWVKKGAAQLIGQLPVSDNNLSFDYRLKKMISGLSEPSPARRNYNWLGSFGASDKQGLLSSQVTAELRGSSGYEAAEDYYSSCASKDLLEKMLYCDQRFYLQDDLLVKVDRASMAASLEARVPFLDREVLEFASRLPSSLKLRGLTTKYILKRTMRARLPQSILHRKKKGFGIPVAKWFKSQLKPLLLEIFQEDKIRRGRLFNPDKVQRLLQDHFENRKDNRKQIYTLLNFQLWYEKYILSNN